MITVPWVMTFIIFVICIAVISRSTSDVIVAQCAIIGIPLSIVVHLVWG